MFERLSLLVFIFAIVFLGISWLRWSIAGGRRKRMYQHLASRYGGNVVSRLFRPRMWFRYGSTMGYLKNSYSRKDKELTVLTLTWPDKRLRFDVGTVDRPFRPHRYSEAIKAEDVGLNDAMIIQSNRPDEFKKMFTQAVKWKVEQLSSHLNVPSVAINLKSGKLTITKPGRIRHFQELDDLVRLGLELHDQLLLTKSEGIDFVDEETAKILGDVRCPICSEDVIDEMVICMRCKTPHCKDCWQYNGHCATFACNETRYFQTGNSASV